GNTALGLPLVLANLPEDREVVVLEMAMRGPGQIRELVEIARPEIGVVTNVGESHLDFFPSRDALASAKGELIEGLPEDGCAILNADDPLAWALRSRARGRVLAFGLERGGVRAAALDTLDEIEGSPRVVVLGDMKELGTRAVEAHRRVGRDAARRRIDLLVAFGPLARDLAAGAREAGGPRIVHTESLDDVLGLL